MAFTFGEKMENLNPIESKLLDLLLGFSESERGKILVAERESTSVGCYTSLILPEKLKERIKEWKGQLPDATGEHPSIPHGGGFLLWKQKDGNLMIEGYTHEGDWPDDHTLWILSAEPDASGNG